MANKASNENMGRIGNSGTSFARAGKRALSGNLLHSLRVFLIHFLTVLALSILWLLSGCAIWTGNVVRYHIIDYPTPKKTSVSPIPDTLMVYRFLLADSVDIHHLVVTSTDEGEETTTLQRWELDPSDMVTELIQRDLEASGLFKKTVDQWSNARYRYALEGTIQRLEGIISDGKASALLKVDVTLIDFDSPLGARKNVMTKEYTIQVPSVDSKPVSIVRAVNLAVRKLSEKIRADIASILTKDTDSSIDVDKPDHKPSTGRLEPQPNGDCRRRRHVRSWVSQVPSYYTTGPDLAPGFLASDASKPKARNRFAKRSSRYDKKMRISSTGRVSLSRNGHPNSEQEVMS